MFSVGLIGGGDSNPQNIECDIYQLITLFPTAHFEVDLEEARKKYSSIPPGADPSKYLRVTLVETMDPITKKNTGTIILPTHQIFNNPNISITPSSPLVKQPAIASASRPPWTVPAVCSPPVSIVPVSSEQDKSAPNSKETQKNIKRTASYPISNRTIKKPRLSITKPTKASIEKLNQIVNHQTKKNDTIVSSINPATLIPSTSNAVMRYSQEITCAQSTKEELPLSKPELNCKEDSPHLNINKNDDGILKKYFFMTDNQFKFDDKGNKSGFSNSNQEMLRIQTKNEMFEITRPELMDKLLFAVGMVMKKTVTKEELETLKQNSDVLQSPKFDWSSETKNFTSTSSTTSPASQNIISSPKNQSNQVSINKSQRHTINLQQPSKQTIQISNSTKQQSASSTISSKMQHSTIIKQPDKKHHVSNNQPNNTSLKHLTTTKHIQTSNKQKLNSKQLPMVSKQPMSTAKKVVNLCQNVKPTVTYQSSIKDGRMCIKCKSVSEDEVCAACRMASHLKNVTVTRIETPSTPAILVPESPIITPIKPIDVPLSSINSVPHDPSIVLLSSEEEEDDEKTVEPIITKVETTEALNKYIGKLTLNPKLLEDKLWQKDLSIKDYFKIEDCYSVHIGSFETVPAHSGDMFVCLYGIRMVIRNPECEPVTIDLLMENVVKILCFNGDKPFIIIYTDHLAAVGIQYLLNMNQDNKKYFYDPLSKDAVLNKIIWFFNLKKNELLQLEKLLQKFSKKKYGYLNINDAHKILSLHKKDEDEIKKCAMVEQEISDGQIVLLSDRLTESSYVIKVVDYKMLSPTEFLNDILVEFYMDYVYTYELSEADRKRTGIFNTYFYTALSKLFTPDETIQLQSKTHSKIRYDRVKKWTKNVKIFEKDFIFIPVNECAHWYMTVICYPYLLGKVNMKDDSPVNTPDDNTGRYQLPPVELKNSEREEADPNIEDLWWFDLNTTQNYLVKRGVDYKTDVANYLKNKHTLVKRPCILIFDSISGGVNRARVAATLRDWMEQEYIHTYNDEKRDFSSNTIKASLVKVPQQPNYVDCGLFAIHYFKLFFEKPIVDYTLPISHLENWFHPDEVSKNGAKRKELQKIIHERMKVRGSVIPMGFKLPSLDFTLTPTMKSPCNTLVFSHKEQTLHRIAHPSDVSNSTNRPSSSNSSSLQNRLHPNSAQNSPKPSTSQNQPKNPNPAPKFQNHNNKNNSGYQSNIKYYLQPINYDEEDVNRQYDSNDHYDEGLRESYERDEYNRGHANIQDRADYFAEMAEHDDPEEEEVDEEEEIEEEEEEEDEEEQEEEQEEEGLEHDYENEPINEFHRNMHANNGIIPYVNDHRPGLGIHRVVAHPNENFQLLRPNNHDVVYNNDNDEDDEIIDEDEGEDIDQIHHPNHDIDEDDYPNANPRINHRRRNNRFNHRRL